MIFDESKSYEFYPDQVRSAREIVTQIETERVVLETRKNIAAENKDREFSYDAAIYEGGKTDEPVYEITAVEPKLVDLLEVAIFEQFEKIKQNARTHLRRLYRRRDEPIKAIKLEEPDETPSTQSDP